MKGGREITWRGAEQGSGVVVSREEK
jgi:hypothetical protein